MEKQIDSGSEADTIKVAQVIGQQLKGSEVIELLGDLGSGKTSFVRGLAAGLGSKDHVHSPSFTLSNQYRGARLRLYHYDFHRLDDAGIMNRELAEALIDPGNVVVVEWPGIIEDVLPAERLVISFRATGQNSRQLSFKYPKRLEYLCSF